jgi:hypothetical protein
MSGLQSVTSNAKETASGDRSLEIRRSSHGDRLINFRQVLLDLFTGTDSLNVLNQNNDLVLVSKEAGLELTAELKRFIDIVKIEAMDEQGKFVNYDLLEDSQAYLEYQRQCTPRLRFFDPYLLSTPEEQLAFWINLYNALIMDGVITKEITQSVGSNPLRLLTFFRQTAYHVGGQRMSCDDIEHGILRGNRGHPMLPGPQFASTDARIFWIVDPFDIRIHFALNCASRSCPPIQVYTAERLDKQLELAACTFVDNDLQVDLIGNQVHLSAIFKWFKADFGGQDGVLDFLIEHLPEDKRKTFLLEQRENISLQYKTYDWGLNSTNLGLAN